MVAVCGLSVAITGGSALAYTYVVIVYDPGNHVENIRQTLALVDQIRRAITQIQHQKRMLGHLPQSIAGGLGESATQLHSQLSTSVAAPNVDSLYPITVSQDSSGWPDDTRPAWTVAQRESISHVRDLMAFIQREMETTAQRIERITAASNGSGTSGSDDEDTGETAALQAQQQLVALCSGEVDKLIALRTVRAKRLAETRARAQSQRAHTTYRRQALITNWQSTEERTLLPVANPFASD